MEKTSRGGDGKTAGGLTGVFERRLRGAGERMAGAHRNTVGGVDRKSGGSRILWLGVGLIQGDTVPDRDELGARRRRVTSMVGQLATKPAAVATRPSLPLNCGLSSNSFMYAMFDTGRCFCF